MSNLPIRRIVLHYSATYADQDFGVEDIRRMHLARGFKDVGYHYVIRRDGRIEKGRPESVVGAHVEGYNTGSIGICCIGGLERPTGPDIGVDNRTEAQKRACVLLIRDLLTRHPGADILGHRDLAATQCPGFDAPAWWAQVERADAGTAGAGAAGARGTAAPAPLRVPVAAAGAAPVADIPPPRGLLVRFLAFLKSIFGG